MLYDPQGVQEFFDSYGTREWERLERTLQGRIRYAIHRRFLDEYVADGARVLDVGCGPGRFSLDLARRGARLTLVDLSQTQLDLARQNLAASNPVVSEGAQIPKTGSGQAAAEALTALELALCTYPGLVDAGEHLLAVAEKA